MLQHGFTIGYSFKTQLKVTQQDIMQYRDKTIQVDMAILDFAKAFDTAQHNKLFYKLKRLWNKW